MNLLLQLLFLSTLIFIACVEAPSEGDAEKWISEIKKVEKGFNDLAQREGIIKAFAHYAAEDVVILRKGEIIAGSNAITEWYQMHSKSNETLTWKPDFTDVSNSGDLAYTYGSFVFTSLDSAGVSTENTGKFHTVWKGQADGAGNLFGTKTRFETLVTSTRPYSFHDHIG